jgi:hypothetical protein
MTAGVAKADGDSVLINVGSARGCALVQAFCCTRKAGLSPQIAEARPEGLAFNV